MLLSAVLPGSLPCALRAVVALALLSGASCDRAPLPAASEKRPDSVVDSRRLGPKAARPGKHRMSSSGLERIRVKEHGPANADSPGISTLEMSQGLTRDLQQAERDLAALEDSIYLFLGDTISASLKQAHASWAQYRKLECDAIRIEFAPGTMAPIAHLECSVALTDARRRFLGEQHDFIRPAPTGARTGR